MLGTLGQFYHYRPYFFLSFFDVLKLRKMNARFWIISFIWRLETENIMFKWFQLSYFRVYCSIVRGAASGGKTISSTISMIFLVDILIFNNHTVFN